jgi:hypothetical protein
MEEYHETGCTIQEFIMKRLVFILILAGPALCSLSAATVSFLVVETGLPADSARPESSSVWESGMMDSFFDAGHIVSNAPILRIENPESEPGAKIPQEARRELDEARLGGADFFVMVLLDYHNDPQGKPAKILIRIFKVPSGQLLYETSCGVYDGDKADEEFRQVKRQAGKILPQLKAKG